MDVIYECDIRDIYRVYGHIRKYEELDDLIMIVRNLILSPKFHVFMEEGACVILEDIDDETCELHIYVDPEKRGRECVEFLRKLKESSDKKRCVFHPPQDAKHIHRLLRYMGAKEVAPFVYELQISVDDRQRASHRCEISEEV